MENQIPSKSQPQAVSLDTEGQESASMTTMAPPDFALRQDGKPNAGPQPGGKQPAQALPPALADGSNLKSPRFSLLLDLEEVFDATKTLQQGAKGRGVQAVQQCLYDLGFTLPNYGADGEWGAETTQALKAFQMANPPLAATGVLGAPTMAILDSRFGAVNLTANDKTDPWTPPGVKKILNPWSPHTIATLKSKITLKSFDMIYWTDEEWDGSAWKPVIFPGGGYNTGKEIGILNKSNGEVASTLYHEVLHANQPKTQTTTLAKESYAYRIGEEFSIGMGIPGHTNLRSTDAQGKEFADPSKVDPFVSSIYPGVSSAQPGDQVIGKGSKPGEVRVQRADGSITTRPAQVGEKIPGPMSIVNEKTHPASIWN